MHTIRKDAQGEGLMSRFLLEKNLRVETIDHCVLNNRLLLLLFFLLFFKFYGAKVVLGAPPAAESRMLL